MEGNVESRGGRGERARRACRGARPLVAAALILALGVVQGRGQEPDRSGGADGRGVRGASAAPLAGPAAIEAARLMLEASMPVSAATLLSRELSRGSVEGDEAVLMAARAYAAQRAWTRARRLLAGRAFDDPALAAEAARTLAEAYAGLDSTRRAVELYRAHLAEATAPPALAVRVGLARTLSRLGDSPGALRELEAAQAENPDLAPWLGLSRLYVLAAMQRPSAFALADSLAGHPLLPADSSLLAAARLAFESGDGERGLALARRGGEGVSAALAERHVAPYLLARGDTAGAAAAYRTALAAGRASADAGTALLRLDRSWRARHEVGRADARAGRVARAVGHLEAALGAAPERERPEIAEALAGALVAQGEPRRALQVLGPWIGGPASSENPASMWLLAARTYASVGESGAADRAYENAARGTGSAAAQAAYLIADAHHDAGRTAEAHAAFERAYTRFPGSNYGSRSLERLFLLDYHAGRLDAARQRLDEYRRSYPRGEWYQGALYWTGRIAEARGDTAAARAAYLETIGHDPLDYYGFLASARIGRDPWSGLELRETGMLPPLNDTYAAALSRMNRLREVGWASRARREYRAVRERGPSDPDQVLAFAHALNGAGWTQEGIAEGWRAKSRRARWSRPLLQAIYPLPFRDALVAAARDRGLSPHFVAGLARRESLFDPEIRSPANAVGLMQLLPETARDVAARAGLPEYRREQLTVPEVNLLLGTRYLADVLGRFGESRVAGMISYNAGPHRYVRWRDFPEFRDPEQLVERIPFRETREYVRAVTELTEIYRFLYPELDPVLP